MKHVCLLHNHKKCKKIKKKKKKKKKSKTASINRKTSLPIQNLNIFPLMDSVRINTKINKFYHLQIINLPTDRFIELATKNCHIS